MPLLLQWYGLRLRACILRWDGATCKLRQGRFHERLAPSACQIITTLGGYFIKLGQKFALTRGIIPEAYIKASKPLFNKVPPRSFKTIADVFQRATNLTTNQAFKEIRTDTLGAASLSQAHRGRLRAEFGEKDVVLKVQYPEVGNLFLLDLDNILLLSRLLVPEIYVGLKMDYLTHKNELDFRNEAKNLSRVGLAMTRAGFSPSKIVIPRPLDRFTCRKIIVMDFLPGDTYQVHIRQHLTSFARALGFENVEELITRYEDRRIHGYCMKSSRKKYLATLATTCAQLKVDLEKRISGFDASLRYNALLLAHHLGASNAPLKHSKLIGSDLHSILDLIIQVHGHQLLIDGFVNIDPHPGNVIIMPDGRLGLIDYGQCATFSPEERHRVAQILLGLRARDKETVAKLIFNSGYDCTNNCVAVAYRCAELVFDRYTEGPIEYEDGIVARGSVDHMRANHSITALPRLIAFAGRLTNLLLGLSMLVGVNTSLASSWEEMATRVVIESGDLHHIFS